MCALKHVFVLIYKTRLCSGLPRTAKNQIYCGNLKIVVAQ